MRTFRAIDRSLTREALLALIVLALAFLNFGHTSAVFAAGGRVVITATSVCGDAGTMPSAGDHFACHGCKPDIAVLPPTPCAVEPVRFIATTVAFVAPVPMLPAADLPLSGSPRGPPSA